MKRSLASIALMGATVMLMSACQKTATGPLETRYELTGDAQATVTPSITSVDDSGEPRTVTEEKANVPWSQLLVINQGETVLEATPSKGALACRIVVEKKEVAKVTGASGQKVTCKAGVGE
ncbi:hypothetical protein Aph02nite_33590 [Actinoplanes philippinensis]|uniref:Membrane protein n=1 Tax=Actinoplanes philippinensis TaxID=35752 RepID=A0A1I2DX86_9ACTN|nr:MmpS family transport accessory protein [Actinoplanes philippinensis]GIE77409.1 hypothetical protein Aph02nite_33590 [Actinoplanes philippinensis]SFE85254.1 membrane protein [Actinoplanes philippinensis]